MKIQLLLGCLQEHNFIIYILYKKTKRTYNHLPRRVAHLPPLQRNKEKDSTVSQVSDITSQVVLVVVVDADA